MLRSLLAASVVLGLQACASVDVRSRSAAQVSAQDARTFALEAPLGEDDPELAAIESEVRQAVVAELMDLGLEPDPQAPDLVVSIRAAVESRVDPKNPEFDHYPAELVEVGTLTVELSDPLTRELIWQGSGRSDLRLEGVPTGAAAVRFTPTNRERNWRVSQKIAAIFDQLRADQVLRPRG